MKYFYVNVLFNAVYSVLTERNCGRNCLEFRRIPEFPER